MSRPQNLAGVSLIAGRRGSRDGEAFRAYNPADGQPIDPAYYSASESELNAAVESAAAAAPSLAASSGAHRARLLRAMADAIDAAGSDLIERAQLETALPAPASRARSPAPAINSGSSPTLQKKDPGSWPASILRIPSALRPSRTFAPCCGRSAR